MEKEMKVPFSKVSTGIEEIQALDRVIRSGWLAAGPETEAFEREFSEYITPKHFSADDPLEFIYANMVETSPGNFKVEKIEPYYCIFTNSCTSALKMAYKYAKEVLYLNTADCPINTFCATYSAAYEMGLGYKWHGDSKIQSPNSWNPSKQFRVNVHYGSVKDETPCLIEDSAHRIEPNDPLVGKIRCYSFYATKNMTTASGGMFVTNDKDIYERARLYWRDGLSTSSADRLRGSVGYQVEVLAGGYDGNDLAAAMGRAQLRKLPTFTRKRNEIRERYNTAFGGNWLGNHLYPYFVDRADRVDPCIEFLKSRGVNVSHHYPGTGWLGISLPIYPDLTEEEQDYVITTVREWEDEAKAV